VRSTSEKTSLHQATRRAGSGVAWRDFHPCWRVWRVGSGAVSAGGVFFGGVIGRTEEERGGWESLKPRSRML